MRYIHFQVSSVRKIVNKMYMDCLPGSNRTAFQIQTNCVLRVWGINSDESCNKANKYYLRELD